jgi:hypothetical protein
VNQFNAFSNSTIYYRCWYNPDHPEIVSLVNGYDACMITTLVGIGIGDGIAGLLFVLFIFVVVGKFVQSTYQTIKDRI